MRDSRLLYVYTAIHSQEPQKVPTSFVPVCYRTRRWRTPIVGCCESRMAERIHALQKVVGVVFAEWLHILVISPTTAGCSVMYCNLVRSGVVVVVQCN